MDSLHSPFCQIAAWYACDKAIITKKLRQRYVTVFMNHRLFTHCISNKHYRSATIRHDFLKNANLYPMITKYPFFCRPSRYCFSFICSHAWTAACSISSSFEATFNSSRTLVSSYRTEALQDPTSWCSVRTFPTQIPD